MLNKLGAILKLVFAIWQTANTRHLSLISAGVAFYTIFAIFPGMAATIAIWGFFANPEIVREYLALTSSFLPGDVFAILEKEMNALLATNVSSFGWATTVTLAVSLYAVYNGVAAMVAGMNAAQERAQTSGLARFLKSLAMTLALIALALVALATIVAVPLMLNFLPFDATKAVILQYLPWVAMFLVVLLVLGLFYRWAPNTPDKRQRWITLGSFLAALFWAAASMAFSIYLANFGNYNRIYGSIGAVIALLMWIYISVYIVLLGAVINAERDRMQDQ